MTRDEIRAKGAKEGKMTNGDKIRTMSDKELAELLIQVEENEILGIIYYAMDGDGYESLEDAEIAVIDWLNQAERMA